MKLLALDIEAIVDSSLWTPPEDDPGAFAPPYAWRPICIGLVLLETDRGRVTTKRVAVMEEREEPTLLGRFADAMNIMDAPTLITWNGRAYDVPVLLMRAMRHGIQTPWAFTRDFKYRYSEDGHCDLKDHMMDFGAARGLHLDGCAKLIGLPGKPKGADEVTGKNVAAAYAAGRHEEIGSYCMADTVQTAFLWLRWSLLKGACDRDNYRAAAADLLRACEAEPRLAKMCEGIDRKTLLLEGE